MRRILRSQKGQDLVEFALILPILVLLLAGIVDLGRAFHSYIVIANASREGARYASHFPSDATAIKQAAVNEAALSGVTIALSDVTIPRGLNGTGGAEIRVRVDHTFNTILGGILGGEGAPLSSIPLHASTSMIIYGMDQVSP
jgi:Flp pilus assembly protein TadG